MNAAPDGPGQTRNASHLKRKQAGNAINARVVVDEGEGTQQQRSVRKIKKKAETPFNSGESSRPDESRVGCRPGRRGDARRGANGAHDGRHCRLLARLQARKPEEVQRVPGELRHHVADTQSEDGPEERTISGIRVSRLRMVRDVADRGLSSVCGKI